MERYTMESLVARNNLYQLHHRVSEADVAKVNEHLRVIESSRTTDGIQPGDIVEYTTQHGSYFEKAHVEKRDEETGRWIVCERASSPFVSLNDEKDNIRCLASGGIWCSLPNNLRYVGTRKKSFVVWGVLAVGAHGAIEFEATVNVWAHQEPEPLYGDYTTKDYARHYISYVADKLDRPKNGSNYRYFGDGFVFATKEDYEAWRDTFKGVEFPGHGPNQTVVFLYKSISVLLSEAEYEKLNLPTDTRQCNGVIEVKVLYDDEKHTVTEYRCTNNGDELRSRGVKPYALARSRNIN